MPLPVPVPVPVPDPRRHHHHHHHHHHGRGYGGYGGGYGGYPGGYGGGYPGGYGGFGGGQSACKSLNLNVTKRSLQLPTFPAYANAQSFSANFGPFSFSASNANSAANSFGFGR